MRAVGHMLALLQQNGRSLRKEGREEGRKEGREGGRKQEEKEKGEARKAGWRRKEGRKEATTVERKVS